METKRTWAGMVCLLGMWFVLAGAGETQGGTGTIEGYKFSDLNQDGVWDSGEPGLSGWTIYLDQNHNGMLDPNESRTTTDPNTGFYQFEALAAPATYYVREVNKSLWVRTLPEDPNDYNLQVEAGQVYSNVNFGNFYTGGTIEGYKFSDLNNNGVWDSGEPGLSGWTIYLDQNCNGMLDLNESRTITDPNTGFYQFEALAAPATYYVREVNKSLWVRTLPEDPNDYNLQVEAGQVYSNVNFGNFYPTCTIEGYKFSDLNQDGVWDPGEPGLSGWTVYLDQNQNNIQDFVETCAITNSSGYYQFVVAAPATYYVREVNKSLWDRTLPEDPNDYNLQVEAGQVYSNVNFGNFYTACTIEGYKFSDLNQDGVWDPGESALSGWRIYLDQNNNGVLDSGETNTTTNSSGYYKFIVAAPATYYVREVNQSPWNQTLPGSPDYSYTLQTQPGQVYSNVNFGNFYSTCTIAGYKFSDLNNNGVWDSGEPGLSGWTIYLDQNRNGMLDLSESRTTTDPNTGFYQFEALAAPATYYVREVNQSLWNQTLPGSPDYGYTLQTQPEQVYSNVNFGNFYTACTIQGYKFNDLNNNGVWDSGESAMSGWKIYLDQNNNGTLDSGETSITTNSSGFYQFVVAAPGTYYVREVEQLPWTQTLPGSPDYSYTLQTQPEQVYNANFANFYAYSGGSGTAADPYQIVAIADWQVLMATSTDWNKYYILIADLDLQGITLTPVGNLTTKFTGSFNGNGHIIRNATINTPSSDYVGLFGYIGTGGQVYNLGLESAAITGRLRVGGLVGRNFGAVRYCYTTGAVTGVSGSASSAEAGGLIGINNSTVSNCYATATVTSGGSGSYAGGLIGFNSFGTVSNCYATATVTSGDSGSYAGGLIGYLYYGTVNDCYATGAVTGSSAGGLIGYNNTDYGTVSNCYATGAVTGDSSSHWVSPCAGGLIGYNNTSTVSNCYATGAVTGSGHNSSVGGLVGYNSKGSISYCYAMGTVTGYSYLGGLGGLVGYNEQSMVSYCYATGAVTGTSNCRNVGGLIGYNNRKVSYCYAMGTVTGYSYIGGLIGYNNSTVSNCYAMGTVTGYSYIGGFIGFNSYGAVSYSYATGAVTGSSYTGGLVGEYSYPGFVSNCFWDIQTSGWTTSAGGTGKLTAEMKTLSTFTSAGWDFVGETVNGSNDLWRMCADGVNYPQLTWDYVQYGDFACPDGVSTDDLLRLSQDWLLTYSAAFYGADANGDKTVSLADFEILAQNWLDGI